MKRIFPLVCFTAAIATFYSAVAAERAPQTVNPASAGDGVQIGVSKRDGITITGGEAQVTRNGATEKLVKELKLPSGVIAKPDGTIMNPDGTHATLRATQILTFDGKVIDLPVDPSVNPGDPRGNGTGAAIQSGGSGSIGGALLSGRVSGGGLTRSGEAGNASVFLDSAGVPFMGTLNANGTITRADGSIIAANNGFRAVMFAADGTPSLGNVGPNGTITRTDGSVVSSDGSVRSANGTLISPPIQSGVGAGAAGTTNTGVRPQNASDGNSTTNGTPGAGLPSTGNAPGSGQGLGSPVNPQGTSNQQGSSNQQGTSNQQRTSDQQGASGQQGKGGATGGSSRSGGTSGGNTGGSTGDSSGSAGGSTR